MGVVAVDMVDLLPEKFAFIHAVPVSNFTKVVSDLPFYACSLYD